MSPIRWEMGAKSQRLRSLASIQRWLAELVVDLTPAELDRGNAQGFATLVRQLVIVTSELEQRKLAAGGKTAPKRRALTESALDEQQKALDEWRKKLERRKLLGATGDRAA